MNLKPNEIEAGIVALAKLGGYFNIEFDKCAYVGGNKYGRFIGNHSDPKMSCFIPDYPHDDAAMDRVVRLFDAKTLIKYALELSECVGTGLLEMLPCLKSDAEQKFEAACRALGITEQ